MKGVCYALATGPDSRSVVSVAYTADGRPAFIDYYRF
jgi:hypothetical protein